MPKKLKNLKSTNPKKRKRILFIAGAFLISLIALIFIVANFRDNIVFFYSPTELQQLPMAPKKIIRVGGLIKENSVKNDLEKGLVFEITDLENDLTISYKGIKPDLFREGQGMVARGKLDKESGIFYADELLAKHDENYMPPEVKKSLKNKDSKIKNPQK